MAYVIYCGVNSQRPSERVINVVEQDLSYEDNYTGVK